MCSSDLESMAAQVEAMVGFQATAILTHTADQAMSAVSGSVAVAEATSGKVSPP